MEVGAGSIWDAKALKSGRAAASHPLDGREEREAAWPPGTPSQGLRLSVLGSRPGDVCDLDTFPCSSAPQFPQGVGLVHSWMWALWRRVGEAGWPPKGSPMLQASSEALGTHSQETQAGTCQGRQAGRVRAGRCQRETPGGAGAPPLPRLPGQEGRPVPTTREARPRPPPGPTLPSASGRFCSHAVPSARSHETAQPSLIRAGSPGGCPGIRMELTSGSGGRQRRTGARPPDHNGAPTPHLRPRSAPLSAPPSAAPGVGVAASAQPRPLKAGEARPPARIG